MKNKPWKVKPQKKEDDATLGLHLVFWNRFFAFAEGLLKMITSLIILDGPLRAKDDTFSTHSIKKMTAGFVEIFDSHQKCVRHNIAVVLVKQEEAQNSTE